MRRRSCKKRELGRKLLVVKKFTAGRTGSVYSTVPREDLRKRSEKTGLENEDDKLPARRPEFEAVDVFFVLRQ
jgi:hypothetical protein